MTVHGRTFHAHMAAIMLTALFTSVFAQSPSRFQDLATELAARIAGVLTATDQVYLTVALSDDDQTERRQLQEAIAAALRSRGVPCRTGRRHQRVGHMRR